MRYIWAILTNAVSGEDETFNRWYNEVHVPDLMKIPGVIDVQRAQLGPVQTMIGDAGVAVIPTAQSGLAHRYLALYEIETDDIEGLLKTVAERAGTDQMAMTPALDDAIAAMLFELI